MGYPVNNTSELYIPADNYVQIKMTDIHAQAKAHFGECTLDELWISAEEHQVEGCSCCYDASNYRQFICVTLERVS